MMNLDGLKQKWAEHDRKLDMNLRLSRKLLSAANMKQAQSALRLAAMFQALGSLMNFIALLALGSFIGNHIAQIRFVLPAVVLHLGMIAVLIAEIQQIMRALHIDYGKPILAIQKQIESLRVLRIRTTQGILLASPLAWTPLLIVALRGFWGVDAYRVLGGAFLLANLLCGLAFIPVTLWLSKKFGSRMNRCPMIQRLMRQLAGHNLDVATGYLAALSEFEEENRDTNLLT